MRQLTGSKHWQSCICFFFSHWGWSVLPRGTLYGTRITLEASTTHLLTTLSEHPTAMPLLRLTPTEMSTSLLAPPTCTRAYRLISPTGSGTGKVTVLTSLLPTHIIPASTTHLLTATLSEHLSAMPLL